MNKQSPYSLTQIKKNTIIISFTIVFVLVLFIVMYWEAGRNKQENILVINAFGQQRKNALIVSEESELLYEMLQLQSTDSHQDKKEQINKTAATREKIRNAKNEVSKALEGLERGYIEVGSHDANIRKPISRASEYMEEISSLWMEYEQVVNILLDTDVISEESTRAAAFIEINHMKLLSISEQIQLTILDEFIRMEHRNQNIGYTILILLTISVVLALLYLMKYVVLPLQDIFKAISTIGVGLNVEKVRFNSKKKVTPLIAEMNSMFLKTNNLISLIENMNNNNSLLEMMDFINRTFSPFIPYNYIGVALFNDNNMKLKASYGVSDDTVRNIPLRMLGMEWDMNETSLKWVLEKGEPRIINDLEKYLEGRELTTYNQIILEGGIRASIALPLKVAGVPVGIIFFSSSKKNVYREEHINFLKALANSIAISFDQNIFIDDLTFSSILALAKLAEARDNETGNHLERIGQYSRFIAELLYERNIYPGEIGLDYFDNIQRFSPLHDVGKVGIPDSILLKPGKLNREEYEEMKLHVQYGVEVLEAAEKNMAKRGRSLFTMGIEIAKGHHEKWDGSGYPSGIKSFDIPLSARIVAIADVFDALVSKRPYKEPYSFEAALSIIAEGKGKHFDPTITEVVLRNKNRLKKMYEGFPHHESEY